LFLASFVCSFCPRGLSALRAASFSGSPARFHVVWDPSLRRRCLMCRTSGVRLPWQYCQTAVILVFGWIMGPTREARLIAYPPRGCSLRMRREQPVLDRHRPVSNLWGDLWPSLQGGQIHLPVSQPVSTGGVTRRSAPGQLCGVALLARWPSSPRWSPPLPRSAASALLEGSHMPRAEEKSHWIFYFKLQYYININKCQGRDWWTPFLQEFLCTFFSV